MAGTSAGTAAASKSESQISKPSNDEKKGLTKMTSEVTMKQARFEVFKFGLRGLDKASKKDAEIAQLLHLGAKPQKNKCIAYSDYKAQKRLEKEEAGRRKEEDKNAGMMTKTKRKAQGNKKENKSSQQTAAKKSKKGGGGQKGVEMATKMGKFDGGMLKLSAKDLAKIRGK